MTLPRLNRQLLSSGHEFPDTVSLGPCQPLPERVLQFGTGNFLRGFADWMIDGMNAAGMFGGSIILVPSVDTAIADKLNAQDGCYTVLSRGMGEGNPATAYQLVTAVSRALNPAADIAAYRALASQPELRFVVSNTTEAGIVYTPEAHCSPDRLQKSFPAKVCAFLFDRYCAFNGAMDKGMVFLPCELINRNGRMLKQHVDRFARDWALGDDVLRWIDEANTFCDTLVDRIVPGYPASEAAALCTTLGYDDRLITVCEHFHLWVIEGPAWLADELPLARAGYNVIVTDDMQPYRNRKVMVLNGAHTSSVLAAFHAGIDTVEQMMADPQTGPFVRLALQEEILPTLDMDAASKESYAAAVLERFRNPFIRHELLSISLNSVSKWTVRVLPSLKTYQERFGKLPERLAFSLAALLNFYRGELQPDGSLIGRRNSQPYAIRDDAAILAAFAACRGLTPATYVDRLLGDASLWGEDLRQIPGLADRVTRDLTAIETRSMRGALLRKTLRIHPADNVAVALVALQAGTDITVEGVDVRLQDAIPAGHKFALAPLPAGAAVVKYASPIGRATCDIAAGQWVHEHNLATALAGEQAYAYEPVRAVGAVRSVRSDGSDSSTTANTATFSGYLRADGQAGIRNEIWIIPTVGCVNGIAERLRQLAGTPPAGVDGIVVLAHPYGCSQLGNDHEKTRQILADLARHPNAGGVLVLGLGCENNTMAAFRALVGPVDCRRVKFLVSQEVGDEIAAGLDLLRELMETACHDQRQPLPLSTLRIGLKCGGSDGYSGLTANPLLGKICERVVAAGGTTVLTEVPEMFGAEGPLFNRCVSRTVFDQAVSMVNRFKHHFTEHGHPVSENPSPGNRQGGITTLEEKSLGCTQKGGQAPVTAVLGYGDRLTTPGLNLLEGPGNDIVAVTALAAAGCQMVLFTTGRGTPLGGPVPVVKFATHSDLARYKPGWIDFNAGQLLEGRGMDELAAEALALCLCVASGQSTASETLGLHDFAIWRGGITL